MQLMRQKVLETVRSKASDSARTKDASSGAPRRSHFVGRRFPAIESSKSCPPNFAADPLRLVAGTNPSLFAYSFITPFFIPNSIHENDFFRAGGADEGHPHVEEKRFSQKLILVKRLNQRIGEIKILQRIHNALLYVKIFSTRPWGYVGDRTRTENKAGRDA